MFCSDLSGPKVEIPVWSSPPLGNRGPGGCGGLGIRRASSFMARGAVGAADAGGGAHGIPPLPSSSEAVPCGSNRSQQELRGENKRAARVTLAVQRFLWRWYRVEVWGAGQEDQGTPFGRCCVRTWFVPSAMHAEVYALVRDDESGNFTRRLGLRSHQRTRWLM